MPYQDYMRPISDEDREQTQAVIDTSKDRVGDNPSAPTNDNNSGYFNNSGGSGGSSNSSSSSSNNENTPVATSSDSSSSMSASDTMAKIHRERWQDWKDRFRPRLEQLAGYAVSGELTRRDVNNAGLGISNAFSGQRDNRERHRAGLGINLTPAQREASERASGLNEASAKVGARNQARIAGKDRDMRILAGGGNIGLGLQG